MTMIDDDNLLETRELIAQLGRRVQRIEDEEKRAEANVAALTLVLILGGDEAAKRKYVPVLGEVG